MSERDRHSHDGERESKLYELLIEAREEFAQIDDYLRDQDGAELRVTDILHPRSNVSGIVAPLTEADGVIPDRIHVVGSPSWLLISDAAKRVMARHRVCPLRWIPSVLTCEGRVVRDNYWLAYGMKEVDILDYDLSDCEWIPGARKGTREGVGYVRIPVIDARKIPQYDLLFVAHAGWYVSAVLVGAITREDLSGLTFGHVQLSSG